jgi:hypothetical protein
MRRCARSPGWFRSRVGGAYGRRSHAGHVQRNYGKSAEAVFKELYSQRLYRRPLSAPVPVARDRWSLFKLYIRHFSHFGMLYGSLGTLISLMFWFYLSGIAILIGGEINAVLENAAAHPRGP